MDYTKLKAMIAATPGCAGKTAQEIADILNAPSVETYDRIYPPTVQRWLSGGGRKLRLKAAVENEAYPIELRTAIDCALDMKYTPDAYLDFSIAEQKQFAVGLVAAGILTQAEVDLLVNGSRSVQSIAAIAGLGPVTVVDVLNCSTF